MKSRPRPSKQLNHVNIPVLYDFGFDHHDVIYATEFFDGETAESWVTTNGPMPVRVVLRIALQVVSALAAATFQLVMHRAIHPGNILIVVRPDRRRRMAADQGAQFRPYPAGHAQVWLWNGSR